jgi:alkanesulfonate monooxygenase
MSDFSAESASSAPATGGDSPVPGIKLFSTCPQSRHSDGHEYRRQVADVARWSEAAGCQGILIYADNGLVDPWLVAQLVIEATERICPLVAVQPVYMHPYSVAKMISSLAHLHRRRVYVNLLAGGFRNDLEALGDATAHDDRYGRALEYGLIISGLAAGQPFSFEGDYYSVGNLRLAPPIPPDLAPILTISGSSDAGRAVAEKLGAIAIKYPGPSDRELAHDDSTVEVGMRVGVIAREDSEEAWRVALDRFPESRHGQMAHRLATRVSDSSWHHQLSRQAQELAGRHQVYWLGPYENYSSFSPYLVGSHEEVAHELARYLELGFSTFVLDIPQAESDLEHAERAFRRAASVPRG